MIYSFHLLVNNVRMNVKMNVPCVIVILLVCFKGVICQACGNLNYSQPAFKGRNVTIIFKPFEFSATEMPKFYYYVENSQRHLSSTIMSNSTLGVFTTMFDTNLPNSGALYAKYGSCYSPSINLDLQDLSGGCGYIYPRTPNPVLGKNVEIGYYPAPAVIGLTGEYSREWYNESSRSAMTLTEGLLSEEELPNKEFVLTIYNVTRWTTGSYSVKCTKSTTNRLSTERVYVNVTASTQKTYEIPNESEDASLTNSNVIPIVWIVIGLSVIIAVVIISTVIVLARKRFLKKNQHVNTSEPQPVQHANEQENETVEMNEDVTYAQVNKIRTKRIETVGPKTKDSDTNLVYADIDIEHLEIASKPPSRQRPPSPTEYADVHTIRTGRGASSDNIII